MSESSETMREFGRLVQVGDDSDLKLFDELSVKDKCIWKEAFTTYWTRFNDGFVQPRTTDAASSFRVDQVFKGRILSSGTGSNDDIALQSAYRALLMELVQFSSKHCEDIQFLEGLAGRRNIKEDFPAHLNLKPLLMIQ